MGPASGAVVALETSSRPATVAVRQGDQTALTILEEGRAHASDLVPALDALLAAGEPTRVDAVFVGLGPGSYTGLRVGIATALGLARGYGAALFGVPSTEVLAYGALRPGQVASVLLDARGGRLYYARYERTTDDIETRCAPCLLTPQELARETLTEDAILGTEGAADAADLSLAAREQLVTGHRPEAQSLVELAAHRMAQHGPMRAGELKPLYLQAFEAKPRRR